LDWLKIGAAYIATYLLMVVLAPLVELLLSPVLLVVRERRGVLHIALALSTAAGLFAAVLAAFYLQRLLGIRPTWLMFVVPYALIVLNDLRREAQAERVEHSELHGVRRAQTFGSVIGFTVAMLILPPNGMRFF